MRDIKEKSLLTWLPSYLIQKSLNMRQHIQARPQHIMLCVSDHYEPFNGNVNQMQAERRVKSWVENYPKMADRHQDADGKRPQHCWFYPPHSDHAFLDDLTKLCKSGYGDIEMHLHHNHMEPFPDTSDTLKYKILKCIDDYAKYGIFCLPDGSRRFAFIHGDWSLANSGGNAICGVNNEIQILKECGCYADFTFPSLGISQPSKVNRIYYAQDNPDKPKSYNTGKELIAGGKERGDLLMIPGIIGIRWRSRTHKYFPSIEASNLDYSDVPFAGRIDYWVKNAVKIRGRNDYLFIKLHTHGARENAWDPLFGDMADLMFSYLEENYNDGKKYVLHYVTAREMYNIIKATEANQVGSPNKFRDYLIPKYIYS